MPIEEAIRIGVPRKSLQTIEIPKKHTLRESREWLREKGYKTAHRNSNNFRRFRQETPILGAHYYSINLPNGVIFVYQEY